MEPRTPLIDRSRRAPVPDDGGRDDVTALILAVAGAIARVPLPAAPPLSPATVGRYVGDATDTTFNGTREQQIALIARLLLLARTRRPAREPSWCLHELEHTLRTWERDRRRGTANARPRPEDVERRVATFGLADGPEALIHVDTVAMALAELVAVHVLAGAVSVEDGMRSLDAIAPLVRMAAAQLDAPHQDLPPGVYESPGATLAHVDHVAWQIDQILRRPPHEDELRWLRALWLELAAALVFAHDLYGGGASDRTERWSEVQELAVEKMTVGSLRTDPSTYDVDRAIALARAAALPFAGLWLDELHAPGEPALAHMLSDRMLAASAQAVLGAWVAEHQLATLGEQSDEPGEGTPS
jgi:hypothetical protein